LAAATVFEPQLCDYQDGFVSAEFQDEKLAGKISFNPNAPQKPHRVASTVDSNRFIEHYFSVVGG
jgi:hypothetical protein